MNSPAELPERLRWSYNPWRDSPPGWRRPQLALLICLLMAVLIGWSFSVPNTPKSYEEKLQLARRELGAAPFAMIGGKQMSAEEIDGALEQIRLQREQFPMQWLQWSLVGALLLLGMTATLYLPVTYELNPAGVQVSFLGVPSRRAWIHYRNFYPHRYSVHLTTLPTPSALDPFRGHSILFAGNREEVLRFIGAHVERRDSGN